MKAVLIHVVPVLVHALLVPARNRLIVVPPVAHPGNPTALKARVVVGLLHLNDQTPVRTNPNQAAVQPPVRDLILAVDIQVHVLVAEVPHQTGQTVDPENQEVEVRQRHLHTKVVLINPNRSLVRDQGLAVEIGQATAGVGPHPEAVVIVVRLCRENRCLVANIQTVDQTMSRTEAFYF